jgi:hypothetical protein
VRLTKTKFVNDLHPSSCGTPYANGASGSETTFNYNSQYIIMNLKSRILEYINQHKEGVKISDMEKPLGENRMKIGFVTKNLLDEGRIERINNQYFPVSNSDRDQSVFFS